MSYKSGETVYGAAVTRSGWVIASDAYVTDPDCKTYNVNGRGGKVYQLWLFATGFLGAFLMQTFIVGYNAAVNVGPANISTFYLSGAYPCWYLFALLSFVGAAAGISMILKKTAGH